MSWIAEVLDLFRLPWQMGAVADGLGDDLVQLLEEASRPVVLKAPPIPDYRKASILAPGDPRARTSLTLRPDQLERLRAEVRRRLEAGERCDASQVLREGLEFVLLMAPEVDLEEDVEPAEIVQLSGSGRHAATA